VTNDDLFRRAQRVAPGGVHSPVRAFHAVGGTPVFMRAGQGADIEAVDGQRYTDFCLAFGPLILGHAPVAVKAAVAAALERGWSFGAAETASLELAELISARVPWAEQLRFVNSGTEAVMTALRVARAVTGRDKLLKFDGCYHGHMDAMLIRAGSGLAGIGTAGSAGVPAGVAADTLVAPLNDEAALTAVFATHTDIAAAIIEPLPANHGLLPQRQAFLERLAALCKTHGTLLIFDEVITGFRVAFDGYAGQVGINPDLVTWGKIIGGGFPVGAVAGRREHLRHLAPLGAVYQAGTLSANPVAMAAGRATLEALLDGEVYAQLDALGAQLEDMLSDSGGLRLQRAGSMFWVAAGDGPVVRAPADISAAQAQRYAALFKAGLRGNIYLPPSPVEVAFLCAAHTIADVQRLAALLREHF
jgi:glutamate-1-semialdehyde 2,1-aminomutase